MKAVITSRYGSPDVLEVKDVDKPTPKPNEFLVRIKASSVTAAHCAMREGKPLFGRLFLGLIKPKIKISGTDLSGEVVELGSDTNLYKAGDCIMAATDVGGGAYAEYIVLSEKDSSVKKPASVSHIEASGIMEGALTALPFLRDHANLKSGDSILINGASGSIGTAAVQLAKIMGANVTGVCSSVNTNMVKDLGADELIDYTKSDFTQTSNKYDIIFDTVGKLDFSKCKSALNPGGKFLSPVLALSVLKQVLLTKISGNKKVIFAATGLRKKEEIQKDLEYISKLLDEGKIRTIIDRAYSLDQIKDAHEYVETGHKRGNVVLEM